MTEKNSYIHWAEGNEFAKSDAMEKAGSNYESYDGVKANASYRSYIDIEPNISVRDSYTADDYYSFRRNESPAASTKRAIKQCMKAYDKVGIIKNIIDLMGDFASQGITIHHPNEKVQNFYNKWWEKVDGVERSERFLNLLYRSGNVVIYKRSGKVNKKRQAEMSKGKEDIALKKLQYSSKTIPLKYDFLDPQIIDIKNNQAGILSDNPEFLMRVSKSKKQIKEEESVLSSLPASERKNSNSHLVSLPQDKIEVFYYKKDDWKEWANPMISPIIDDINMLEKMKLADMSALDGAISNIRVWKLGSLEHRILPSREAIDKLRDILAANVGGGTMDLVWGPEIDFKESNTQIYKFLGNEKYGPVLSAIYGGIGIPPTLTGLAGQSGGFTNNFISLKTLIERLEYGRSLLKKFWMKELEIVAKAMGFKEVPVLHFDKMILNDEASEKKLLLDLADRNIISIETIRERFGEIDSVETSRVRKEDKLRDKDKIPPKAGPYNNPEQDYEYKKLSLNKGEIGIQDVTDLEPRYPKVNEVKTNPQEKNKNPNAPGRPKNSKDVTKRKQKTVLPRSKANVNLMIWATDVQNRISDIVSPAILASYNKKTLRELSKAEFSLLEKIKFRTLCGIEPNSDVSEASIVESLENVADIDSSFIVIFDKLYSDFIQENSKQPSTDELRQIHVMSYWLKYFSEN
jgi:hypothetical protein